MKINWLPAQQVISGDEEADYFAKSGTHKLEINATMSLLWFAVKGCLKKAATEDRQERWLDSVKGRYTFSLFPRVTMVRCETDFYLNHILTGHGSFLTSN